MSQDEINDSELQKAIDDINRTTSVDPVFSDPVAAPSTVPEGEVAGSLEPIGPFPNPVVQMPPITQEQPQMPVVPLPPQPQEGSVPEVKEPAMESPAVSEAMVNPIGGTAELPQMNLREIKAAALRELMPLLNKMRINPSQKFRICKEAIDVLQDKTALESAYEAATEIADETERGEALIYLVEAIDRL